MRTREYRRTIKKNQKKIASDIVITYGFKKKDAQHIIKESLEPSLKPEMKTLLSTLTYHIKEDAKYLDVGWKLLYRFLSRYPALD